MNRSLLIQTLQARVPNLLASYVFGNQALLLRDAGRPLPNLA